MAELINLKVNEITVNQWYSPIFTKVDFITLIFNCQVKKGITTVLNQLSSPYNQFYAYAC